MATELNKQMENMLHGDTRWLEGDVTTTVDTPSAIGGVSSEEEQLEPEKLNQWISDAGLPEGEMGYDHSDEESGRQIAVFDLAWSDGLQTELSQLVIVLLNEEASTIAEASQAGFRCFTGTDSFRVYVEQENMSGSLDVV